MRSWRVNEILRLLQSAENELYREDDGTFPAGWKNTHWGRHYTDPPRVEPELEPVVSRIRETIAEVRDSLMPAFQGAQAQAKIREATYLANRIYSELNDEEIRRLFGARGYVFDDDGNLWGPDGTRVDGKVPE